MVLYENYKYKVKPDQTVFPTDFIVTQQYIYRITFYNNTDTLVNEYTYNGTYWNDNHGEHMNSISEFSVFDSDMSYSYSYFTVTHETWVSGDKITTLNPYVNNYNNMPYGSYIYNNLDGTIDICQIKGVTESITQKIVIDDTTFEGNCPIKFIKVNEDCILNNDYENPYEFKDSIKVIKYTDGTYSLSVRTGNDYTDDSYTTIAGSSDNKIKAIEFTISNNAVISRDPDIPIIFKNKTMLLGLSSNSYMFLDPWEVNPLYSKGISATISHKDLRNGLLEDDIQALTQSLDALVEDIREITEYLNKEFTAVKQLYVTR